LPAFIVIAEEEYHRQIAGAIISMKTMAIIIIMTTTTTIVRMKKLIGYNINSTTATNQMTDAPVTPPFDPHRAAAMSVPSPD
jgi:hypothetical protein